MAQQISQADSALVSSSLKTTSRNVARDFSKRHDNVVRDITAIVDLAPEWGVLNFEETPYVDAQNGQTYQMYEITRDGFAMLVMGFTGKRAFGWKLKYLEAFNAMAEQLSQPQPTNLTPDQARTIQEAVAARVANTGESYRTLYGALKTRFRVPKYDQIAQSDYRAALDFIGGQPMPFDPHALMRDCADTMHKFRKLARDMETLHRESVSHFSKAQHNNLFVSTSAGRHHLIEQH